MKTALLHSTVCLIVSLIAVDSTRSAEVAPSLQAVFSKLCSECHSDKHSEGELNLSTLSTDWDQAAVFEKWERIFDRLRSGEMPPPSSPQPSATQRQQILKQIAEPLQRALAKRLASDGRVALRRLNRVEYQNTIHDLLGIETNVMELLPEDALVLGFDKISTALTLSPVQMEKYLEAADVALDAAIGVGQPPKYVQDRYSAKEMIAAWASKSLRVFDDSERVVMFNSGYSPTEVKKFRATAPGRYRIRISGGGFQSEQPITMRVYAGNFGVGGKTRLLGHFDMPATGARVVEMVERVENRNDTLKIVPYGTIPWQADGASYQGPGLAIDWVEVEGPLEYQVWPPASRRQLLGDLDLDKGTLDDARRVLLSFATRAFRRPLREADIAAYLSLVQTRLDEGVKFMDALRVGLKAVLVSPRFLMLDEQPGRLDPYALATRLSYFLWSTMPDPSLLEAATRNELREPAQLKAQVDRMLDHPKAKGFTENFTGQWLGLRQIEFTTPDARLYPEFDEFLQISMVNETHAFFNELIRHDLSVLNFVDSDFALLNERLARHYGISGVTGSDIRKVPLQKEWHRGGVMTHGSVLKVTANGTTTSPILRGVWIADRILGRPIPPPPPNVPAVEPDIRGAKSIREQLAKHREQGACARCHTRIDPLGFALENYDVVGGWRERYRISPERGQKADYITISVSQRDLRVALGSVVDAGDELADGRKFAGLDELKQHLLSDPDQIARGLTEKLLIYATGNPLVFTDTAVVDDMLSKARSKQYGLRSLIHELVQSEVFRSK